MKLEQFAQQRFTRTFTSGFKSGLLCAVMLMPTVALADPVEIPTGDTTQTVQPVGEHTAQPVGENTTNTVKSAIPDAASLKIGSSESKPLAPPKAVTLSQHIQRKYKVSEYKATQIVQEAMLNADRHQLEPELILALIAVESTFKERAVSRVGARGLMQVMPGVHRNKVREIGGSRALFDPAKNIYTGSQILVNYLNDHSGDLRRALLNYNGSLGTRSSFADRVMRIYRDFQQVTIQG